MNADHKMKFLHELMKDNNHTYIDIIYKIIFQHENIRAVFSNATKAISEQKLDAIRAGK